MGLRTRILRHPALREFYRNYRVLLTFRGFLLAAAATTLYLLIANTLGLEQTTAAEQGPGAATPPPPPPPLSNVTSHHRSGATAPSVRTHVGATQTPKSAPAVVGRRTRVPTVVVGAM